MVGDRDRGVAIEWQAELPSFSATIFRNAPHLGLVRAETELPAPVRGGSASRGGGSNATFAGGSSSAMFAGCSSASRGSSSTATVAALPARAKRWQQKAAASTAARHTASEAGQHLPRQSSIADQALYALWLAIHTMAIHTVATMTYCFCLLY